MRLGKDVLEADLYGELGLLPDATESEIRVAYRREVRSSHPDLNQADPEAMPRMKRLNVAARVLLDPALRRAYDRMPLGAGAPAKNAKPARQSAWFERRELGFDDEWATVPPPERHEPGSRFGAFFKELRGPDGQLSLRVQSLIESLSVTQQLGVAALLCAIALGFLMMSRPHALVTDVGQHADADATAEYP